MAKELGKLNGQPTHEEIAQRAYALFERNGKLPGHEMENWLQAEAQLMADRKHAVESRSGSRAEAKPAPRQQLARSRA